MSAAQFDTVIKAGGYPKLADYLHTAYPGKVVAAIGEKNYAVHTMGGPGADMRITFGGRTADCDDVPNEPTDLTWRGPAGVGVPAYICEPGLRPLLRRRRPQPRLRHPHHLAGLDVPVEGNRDVPGHRPRAPGRRRLGDRRGLRR